MPTVDEVEARVIRAMERGEWPEVARLAAELDRLAVPKAPVELVRAALWYAEQGLPVFPLQPRSKVPWRRSRGCKDATTDTRLILGWWRHEPASNIGLATGSPVDVIDVDGALGARSWARATNLPPILGIVSTPRPGGTHLYVASTGAGNRAGFAEGVDYRGRGGYVVAPPSVSADGVPYEWRRPLDLTELGRLSRLTCVVCGERMITIEYGQLSHPSCDGVGA